MSDKANIESTLLTPAEACSYLRISKPTLYKMIKDRSIPVVKIGKQYRIKAGDLNNIMGDSRYDR